MPVTTDEEALLAAIAAAPRDDAPRLVYADWLQDRGEDGKAAYLRSVVGLMHDPDDRTAIGRCVELSSELDAHWRRHVGGRFEVVIEGSGAVSWIAHMFVALFKLPFREQLNRFEAGRPVRLQSGLTREEADRVAEPFIALASEPDADCDVPFRIFVQTMTDDATLSLFSPQPPG